jgi:hypothetical protein
MNKFLLLLLLLLWTNRLFLYRFYFYVFREKHGILSVGYGFINYVNKLNFHKHSSVYLFQIMEQVQGRIESFHNSED